MVAKGEGGGGGERKKTNICKLKMKRMSCNERVAETALTVHRNVKTMIYYASSDEKTQFRVVCVATAGAWME